jgi:hypothetical protein
VHTHDAPHDDSPSGLADSILVRFATIEKESRRRMKMSAAFYAAFVVSWLTLTLTRSSMEGVSGLTPLGLLFGAVIVIPRSVGPRDLPDVCDPKVQWKVEEAGGRLRALQWTCTKIRMGYLAGVAVLFIVSNLVTGGPGR